MKERLYMVGFNFIINNIHVYFAINLSGPPIVGMLLPIL